MTQNRESCQAPAEIFGFGSLCRRRISPRFDTAANLRYPEPSLLDSNSQCRTTRQLIRPAYIHV